MLLLAKDIICTYIHADEIMQAIGFLLIWNQNLEVEKNGWARSMNEAKNVERQ